jgi:hypothetical protein
MALGAMSWLKSEILSWCIALYFRRNGMSSLAVKFDNHAVGVSFTKTAVHFVLADGREISAPLEWFPKLRDASDADRHQWRFIGNGIGVHWPSIDEDIAVKTLMQGN